VEPVGPPQARLDQAILSPDGRRIATVATERNNQDIWIIDRERGARTRLTTDDRPENDPRWLPDGQELLYTWIDQDARPYVYRMRLDGSKAPERVVEGAVTDVSSDGRWIVVERSTGAAARDLFAFDLKGAGEAVPVVVSPSDQRDATLSPDARYVVYRSDESGAWEVYVQRFPAGEGRWQVSTSGGTWPWWSRPEGDRIFYVDYERRFVAVSVTLGPTPTLGAPRVLFEVPETWLHDYDVRQGRFLASVPASDDSAKQHDPLRLVENWHRKFESPGD
jgi:Tol biopolymer transport system component